MLPTVYLTKTQGPRYNIINPAFITLIKNLGQGHRCGIDLTGVSEQEYVVKYKTHVL